MRRRGVARGHVLVFAIIMMVCLLGFASLAVDYGRAQLAKTELERAVFAASRYAATGLTDGTAVAKAIAAAADNTVDGTPLVLQSGDVVVGTWSGGAFAAGGSSPNAVQVNGYRTAARGTALPLVLANLIGGGSCDIACTGVVATLTVRPVGFAGLTSFPIDKKLFAASYNSSVTTSPSHSSYNSNCVLQCNGTLGQGSHAGCFLYGNATLGPGGSVAGGINVTGATTTLASAITATAVSMSVVTNPGGVSRTPNVSSNVTWPAGTYYFTSLTVQYNKGITFSGPATIYLDGNATLGTSSSITAYQNIPAYLKIYQSSGNTFTASDSATLVAVYDGPGASVSFGNYALIEGAMTANSITLADNDDVYYDEALGTSNTFVTSVK